MRVKRRYRASVIGLWTLSGTWCAKELTDGRVPFHMLDELACTKAQAALLVECGLWADHPTGYVFIGWEKYQPTRAKVEAERKKEADRKANYRMSHRDTGGTPPGLPRGHQAESGHPDPTRPDPTNKEIKNIVQPAVELQSKFDEWWKLYPRKTGKLDAFKAFKATLKVTDMPTLMEGTRAYVLLNMGQDKRLIKMPAGWLRSGRWADEDQVAYTPPDAPFVPQHRAPRLATELTECDIHRGYPLPCDACLRDPLTPEGADF